MRQLITRIDNQLHEDLKARAAAEGRSVNALVTQLLETAVTPSDERQAVSSRVLAAGLRDTPRPTGHPVSRDAAIAMTRGAGSVVSEALAVDRNGR